MGVPTERAAGGRTLLSELARARRSMVPAQFCCGLAGLGRTAQLSRGGAHAGFGRGVWEPGHFKQQRRDQRTLTFCLLKRASPCQAPPPGVSSRDPDLSLDPQSAPHSCHGCAPRNHPFQSWASESRSDLPSALGPLFKAMGLASALTFLLPVSMKQSLTFYSPSLFKCLFTFGKGRLSMNRHQSLWRIC